MQSFEEVGAADRRGRKSATREESAQEKRPRLAGAVALIPRPRRKWTLPNVAQGGGEGLVAHFEKRLKTEAMSWAISSRPQTRATKTASESAAIILLPPDRRGEVEAPFQGWRG